MSELFRFKGHSNAKTLSFSADGQVVCAWHDEYFRDVYGSAVLWGLGERMELGAFSSPNGIRRALVSPDGSRAYAVTGQGEWALLGWDANTEKPLEGPAGKFPADVWALAISPDGATIAAATDDRKAHLFDAATRQPKSTLEGYEGYTIDVAFTPDGKYLVALSKSRDLAVWLVARGKRRAVPALAAEIEPACLAVSPDGSCLAVGDGNGHTRPKVALINLEDGALRPGFTAASFAGGVDAVSWSADGKALALVGNGKLTILDAITGEARKQAEAEETYTVAFAPGGKHLLLGRARDIVVHDAAALLA